MTALIAFLISNPTILAIGAGILAAAGAWMHGRVTGAAAERNKQAAGQLVAAQDRIQMDREATASASKVTSQTDAQAKAEAAPWVRS
jgi:outer membrane murein-binding lipoprotein Lpp